MSKYILFTLSMKCAISLSTGDCTPGSALGLGSLASTCVPCPAGTWSPGGSTACTACSSGYFTGVKTGAASCNSQCQGGSAPSGDSTSCVTCSIGTYAVTGASSCTACPAGQYTSTSGATSCEDCPAGYYCPSQSLPIMCSAGKTSPSKSSTLSSCQAICSGNGYIPSDSTSCTCKTGFTGSNCQVQCNGVGTVVNDACVCNAGYSNPTGDTTSCYACAIGYYGANTFDSTTYIASTCTQCIATFTTSGVGAATTSGDCICAVGRVRNPNDLNQCKPCSDIDPYSTTASAGATECTCIAGYYPDSTGACTSCGGGGFTTTVGSATDSSACVCADGYSSKSSTANDCSVQCSGNGKLRNGACQCNAGWVNSGITTGIYCDICDVGFYSAAGTCSSCPGKTTTAGTGSNLGSGACDICVTGWTNPPGTDGPACTWECGFSNGYTKKDCTSSCLPGWYKDGVEGSSTYGLCVQCGAHQTSPLGSTSVSACTCAASYYESGTGCVACASGLTSLPGNGDSSSCGCAPGWYAVSGKTTPCQACPSGMTTSGVGATAKSECSCALGSYLTSSGSCKTCGGRGYTTPAIGQTDSSSCMCDVGWFATGSSPLVCSSCPPGLTSIAGSTSVGACNACARGTFQTSPVGYTPLMCAPCGPSPPASAGTACAPSFVVSTASNAGQESSESVMHPLSDAATQAKSSHSALHQLKKASARLRKLQDDAHRLVLQH